MKKFMKDYMWDCWFSLPHCRIIRKNYEISARRKFNYEKNGDMSLITVNCLGGEIYHILGLQFRSPLINTSMGRKDFVKLAKDPQGFFSSSLVFQKKDSKGKWVATLTSNISNETISITFPHEKDEGKIYSEFEKRRKRVNYDNLYFIMDDDGLTNEDYELFAKVKCTNKIVFTSKDLSYRFPFAYQLKEYAGGGTCR